VADGSFGKEESGGEKIAQGVRVRGHPPDAVWATKCRVGAEEVGICSDGVCEETRQDCEQERLVLSRNQR